MKHHILQKIQCILNKTKLYRQEYSDFLFSTNLLGKYQLCDCLISVWNSLRLLRHWFQLTVSMFTRVLWISLSKWHKIADSLFLIKSNILLCCARLKFQCCIIHSVTWYWHNFFFWQICTYIVRSQTRIKRYLRYYIHIFGEFYYPDK